MGAPRQELFAAAASDVQVEVQLTRGFRIGQTEVTRAQWLALGLPEPRVDWRRTGSDRADVPPAGYSPCNEPDCPVLWISYEDGMAYTNLLSEREGLEPCYQLSDCVRSAGDNMRCQSVRVNAPNPYECRGYRLPTAAEWEYATRAGTKGAYYSGDMHSDPNVADNCGLDPNLDKIGWYCGNSGSPPGQPGGRAHPVAQKQPNAWGLYDTSGNAYEWVNDLFNPLGYGRGPLTDPVGGVSDPSDLTPAKHPVWGDYRDPEGFPGAREYRGGAFDLWSSLAKSSRRLYMSVGGQHTGFRVARSVQP